MIFTELRLGDVGNKHWIVKRVTNPHFTGRLKIVDKIIKMIALETFNDQRVFVLTGIGGQGKSEVSLHVANEVREM